MHKDCIARLTVLGDPLEGILNVALGRRVVTTVVHQDEHLLLAKALVLNEVLFDVSDVVVAATELTLLTDVVDADCEDDCECGATPSCRNADNDDKTTTDNDSDNHNTYSKWPDDAPCTRAAQCASSD